MRQYTRQISRKPGVRQDGLALTAQRVARRRVRRRAMVDRLLAYARFLPAADHLLIRQMYELGVAVEDIAQLANTPKSRIYCRLRSLERRLLDPVFTFVVDHRDRLPPPLRRVAELALFECRSAADIARATGQTIYATRTLLHALEAMAACRLAPAAAV